MSVTRISAAQIQTSENFLMLPHALLEFEQYKGLKIEFKVGYALLKERFSLSIREAKNGKSKYIDENGNVFAVYSNSKLQEILGFGKDKVIRMKKELAALGLLEEVPQISKTGAQLPNRLYLGMIDSENKIVEKTSEKPIVEGVVNSDRSQNTTGGVAKTDTSNINDNKIDSTNSNTNNITSTKKSSAPTNKTFLSKKAFELLENFGEQQQTFIDVVYEMKRMVENFQYAEDKKKGVRTKLKLQGENYPTALQQTVQDFLLELKKRQAKNQALTREEEIKYFRKVMKNFWENCLLKKELDKDDFENERLELLFWYHNRFKQTVGREMTAKEHYQAVYGGEIVRTVKERGLFFLPEHLRE